MSDDTPSTKQRIVDVTRRQLDARGVANFTIQGVADELGKTKQAVLYWFPSKSALLREALFDAIEAESDVLVAAVERADDAAEAIENFMRDGYAHHRDNISRFRLMYLTAQTERALDDLIQPEMAAERIYPVTSRFYSALEQKLRADPAFPAGVDARNFAVSLHMCVLGHACMRGSMDAVGDDFRQTFEEMIDAMLGVLTRSLR
jgi:AcrR family transcriptional regulator